MWELGLNGFVAVTDEGTVSQTQMIQLALAWKGITNFLGWAGVAPNLQPNLRGPIAYVMGHRYLRLGQPKDASMFFNTALTDAPNGSPLATMAQAELDRLLPSGSPVGARN